MTPQATSIKVKEYLTAKHDSLNQLTSAKKIKDLTNYVKLSQSHKILDTKGFFTSLKTSQQIKQIVTYNTVSLTINNILVLI